ncbi:MULTISPECIES: hypothetical protein [unclassified Saccharicrinis]|uniref:hypothetical protein n=1 Tax=unclassified Saccharicrinis TaxID=2646859 RepID=UPI003D3346DE
MNRIVYRILICINFSAALVILIHLMAHNRTKGTYLWVVGLLTLVLSISVPGGIYGMAENHKKWPNY